MIHHFILMTYMLFIFRQWLIVFCVIATKCNTFYYNQKNRRCKKLRKSFAKTVRWIKRKIRLKKLLSFVIVNYETRGLLLKVWTAPIDNYELWAIHKWSVFFFKDVNDDKKIRLSLTLVLYLVDLFILQNYDSATSLLKLQISSASVNAISSKEKFLSQKWQALVTQQYASASWWIKSNILVSHQTLCHRAMVMIQSDH